MDILAELSGLLDLGASNGDIIILLAAIILYRFFDKRLKPETVEKSVLDRLITLLSIAVEKQEETLSALTKTVIKQEIILEYLANTVSDCPKAQSFSNFNQYDTGPYQGVSNTYEE